MFFEAEDGLHGPGRGTQLTAAAFRMEQCVLLPGTGFWGASSSLSWSHWEQSCQTQAAAGGLSVAQVPEVEVIREQTCGWGEEDG